MPICLEGTICSSDQYLGELMHLDQTDLKIRTLVLSKLQGINNLRRATKMNIESKDYVAHIGQRVWTFFNEECLLSD